MLKRRKPRPDRARALSQAEVEQMLTARENISLRERTLWRMLYETAARSAEVLALNVEPDDREILALPEHFGPAGGLVSAGRQGRPARRG
jgi:integrase